MVQEPWGYEYDGEGYCKPGEDRHLTNQELLDLECAIEYWVDESVWFTREEACTERAKS